MVSAYMLGYKGLLSKTSIEVHTIWKHIIINIRKRNVRKASKAAAAEKKRDEYSQV